MRTIEVKTTMRIDRDGNNLICYDVPTIQTIMGSTGVTGNYHYYDVKKVKGTFVVSIDTVKKRIEVLEQRRNRLNEQLEIMKQVVAESIYKKWEE